MQKLKHENVEAIDFKKYKKIPTDKEVIEKLDTHSNTEGSCASLSFAYTANKAGYDVTDSRGGASEIIFRDYNVLYEIATLDKVKSKIIWSSEPFEATKQLLKEMEVEKEYNLIAGMHSAIVKKN